MGSLAVILVVATLAPPFWSSVVALRTSCVRRSMIGWGSALVVILRPGR